MRKPENKKSDVEECRDKINELLREYDCHLMSADECSNVLIYDNDTYEIEGGFR